MKKALAFLIVTSLLLSAPVAPSDDDQDAQDRAPDSEEFTFLRLVYSGGGWRDSSWATDYPKADLQFLYGLRKLADFTFVSSEYKALPLDDPEIFKYPFIYAVEVGRMYLSDEEAAQLREHLLRGGFLVVDDFHGHYEWQNFYFQMKKVFPEYEPVDLPLSHPIFHCYHDIEELIQVPGIQYLYSGRTWEKGGYNARYMGIQDESGRLMVMINYNVDLGDAWEWAEVEAYPREYATLAFKLGMNYIIYAMTH
ncbi:MAG: DUF4159 domain-containing protein [Acidobacteriota bacterium]